MPKENLANQESKGLPMNLWSGGIAPFSIPPRNRFPINKSKSFSISVSTKICEFNRS